ncbi:cytochrome c [Elongatibacter sediminis]|uniref:Cytochrome c n=1 Tax=Elongatibacter sediminis TaxID=3119006 RepID=A0AAW9RDA7_9GAMM
MPAKRLAAFTAVAVGLGAAWWLTSTPVLAPEDIPDHQPDAAAGERLFHAGGCRSCHGERLEGGLELSTEYGIFRVPNITPDPVSGIGGWTTLEFVNAMSRGVSPEGQHYYPAFPYASYARMTVTDLLDLKAWLDEFPPVPGPAVRHELRFPWNIRRAVGFWNRLYLDPAPVVGIDPSAPNASQLERGRYLVEAVGHCGECHTPRGFLGGPDSGRWLAGAPNPEGEGRVPNITPHDDGIGAWSEKDLAWYFESGFTPDYDTVGGAMVEVQENLAELGAEDRAAIATYLKSIPALPDAPADG